VAAWVSGVDPVLGELRDRVLGLERSFAGFNGPGVGSPHKLRIPIKVTTYSS